LSIFAAKKSAKLAELEFQAFQLIASQVVDVIATAGMVLDRHNTVVKASAGAQNLNLVENRRLAHAVLISLVNQARESDGAVQENLVLETGLRKEPMWVFARAAKFGDHYVMLVVDDRTEGKKVEDTRRDFVANVSHELKTPIGAIVLLAEALEASADDPDMVRKFAGNVQKESARLNHLVQELIQLSRVQGGKSGEYRDHVALGQVIADAIDRNQTFSEQRGIKVIATQFQEASLQGDYEMLVVAVKNLIENAIAYSNPGSQVGVGLKLIESVAEISITDSGIGIPESEQERIFERFYRVDQSRSRETGGTGLGLSIVKHIVSNHSGEIKLFSKPQIGSTFTIRIPLNNKESQ
jgi:two-component system sensor histidine kinase SenX3